MNKALIRIYQNREQATELAKQLIDDGVNAYVADNSGAVDLTFSNSKINEEFQVLVDGHQYVDAMNFLVERAEKELHHIPEDHYLYSFTDEEIMDVLRDFDEWNEVDIALSSKIAKDRNLPITSMVIDDKKDSVEPNDQIGIIVIAYILLLIAPIVSAIIGWILAYYKKQDKQGSLYYVYSERAQKQGKIVMWLGIIFLALFVLAIVFRDVAYYM
ncbi:hypothetical protein [Sanyastnella coralliicola]|uniref:hypothetical protein n=1 Tax=Sanyastnella coralliicola TaxID=3069118 RepID=UPI0027BACC33|nr:hypothetical protein [Longitalea sp. SCSIO 12813]